MIKFKLLVGYFVDGPISFSAPSEYRERALDAYKRYLINQHIKNTV